MTAVRGAPAVWPGTLAFRTWLIDSGGGELGYWAAVRIRAVRLDRPAWWRRRRNHHDRTPVVDQTPGGVTGYPRVSGAPATQGVRRRTGASAGGGASDQWRGGDGAGRQSL